MLTPLGALRRGIGQALRSRVAGDDAAERAARIWGTPGERWFTEADAIHRVHRDAAMFVGGIRALLLQSLHPLAMAGVAAHSGFRGDPWGRLQRTSHFLAVTTFGTVEDAERAIARVRGIHRRVTGAADDGRPYAASDPHLLNWVHVAEVDSFLRTHQLFGEKRLDARESDEYVAQSASIARRLGAEQPPTTVAELREQLHAYRPELAATPAARDAAKFLLVQPPLPALSRPGYGLLAAGAISSLPGWARRELRLPPPFPLWDVPGRTAGRAAAGVVRWAMTDPAVDDRRAAS